MNLTYLGLANRRIIRVTDVEKHLQLEDFEEAAWERGESQEVPDALGEWLLENYAKQFTQTWDEEEGDDAPDDSIDHD